MYRSPKILKSASSGSACVRWLVKDVVEAVKENSRNTARHLSLPSRITPVFKVSKISAVGDQTICSFASSVTKPIYEYLSKRIEELVVEKTSLKIEKNQVEEVFDAVLGKSFMDFIFSHHVKKYMPEKENGQYTKSQLIDGYTQFLNSNDDLALMLKKKFPNYSTEKLGLKIIVLHSRLSRFVQTVQESARLFSNIQALKKFFSSMPFKCVDPELIQTLNLIMEAYSEVFKHEVVPPDETFSKNFLSFPKSMWE